MAARNKGSLSQQVAKQLLSDFQEGVRYRPGDKLPNENDLAGEYGVMSIPTVIFFKGGREIDRKVGVMPADAYTAILDANL